MTVKKNSHGLRIIENTRTRVLLYKKDPACFWCGRFTMLGQVKPMRDYTATVDHLYSRLHPKRNNLPRQKVLACYRCNQDRSAADVQGKVFIPALASRVEIARQASAAFARGEVTDPLAVQIDTIEKAIAFARAPSGCQHVAHDTLAEACHRRDELRRATGTESWFIICPKCSKWKVNLTHKPTKAVLRQLAALAAQEKVPVNEYLSI